MSRTVPGISSLLNDLLWPCLTWISLKPHAEKAARDHGRLPARKRAIATWLMQGHGQGYISVVRSVVSAHFHRRAIGAVQHHGVKNQKYPDSVSQLKS